MNWQGTRSKWSWSNQGTVLPYAWWNQWNPHRTLILLVFWPRFQTMYLLSTSVGSYHHS